MRAVAFSPNGEMLATAGVDTKINVYSVANDFSRMHTLEGHNGWVQSLSFSSDSTRLVSGSGDRTIRLWNLTEGMLLKKVDNAQTRGIASVTHSETARQQRLGRNDQYLGRQDAEIEVRNRRRAFRRCKRP